MNDSAAVTQELVTLASQAAAEIEPFSQELATFRARYDGVVYDLTDPKQGKQARSDRLAIGKVVARLDKRHAELKAPLLEATRLLDGKRKDIKDGLLEVQGRIKSQIESHEAKEKDRVDALRLRLAGIQSLVNDAPSLDTSGIAELLAQAQAVEVNDGWQEFEAEAALAKMRAVETLTTAHAAAVAADAEREELARLRAEAEAKERAEREERIRAEAEAKAKADAEQAVQAERKRAEQAEARAKAEAAEAEARAKRKAEEHAAAIERAAEQARAAESARIARDAAEAKAKAEADARAEEQRKAKTKHRARIHKETKQDLLSVAEWLTDEQAVALVEAIRDKKIAHVSITY